jgi:N-acetylglucosaminyldiphosphoundecaprenol N-acetyl-beta-D-mannosaminyltransferase
MPQVLGIQLYGYDIPTLASAIIGDIASGSAKENKLISATGAHGIVTAQKDAEFKNILSSFYCNIPDGMPSVWVGKMKGAKLMKRCAGPDFFRVLMTESAEKPITHFFCGGKQGVAEELKAAVGTEFHNYHVVGTFCPPFRDLTNEEVADLGNIIKNSGADIVWIGLSSPKQEKFAFRLSKFTITNYIITVGAAFDFHTGKLSMAPRWMQQSGLEWLYRLYMEPRRLFKRYFSIVPLFIYYNIKEFLKLKNSKL